MAYNMGGRRFRPVGSGKKRTAPQYGPVGTGCPFVEEAVARLYREQNEEHFWSLMNALNYALELQTKVLVPLDAAVDPQSGAAPWAHLPIPEERAEGLPPWLLHTRKERNYLPLFTSVKNAEAEKASATRPMVERSLRSAMEYALETDGIDGVVLDPWTSSATLDVSLLSGLLKSERGSDNPGAQELEAGHAAARAGDWQEAAARYTAAAEAGSAEALSALGDCLYYGRGARKNKTQARRMWKKAAQAGEVQAMIALGDDCAASGGEMAETLQYYRRAQSAAREVPDIAYTPQVCLRLAQYETQYLSRKKALLLHHGYPEDYLQSIYTCPDCKDTGYQNNEPCHCLKNAEIKALYESSNLMDILNHENFDTFDDSYYDDTIVNENLSLTARQNIRKVKTVCLDYIKHFDDSYDNLIFYGSTGVGKPF